MKDSFATGKCGASVSDTRPQLACCRVRTSQIFWYGIHDWDVGRGRNGRGMNG